MGSGHIHCESGLQEGASLFLNILHLLMKLMSMKRFGAERVEIILENIRYF